MIGKNEINSGFHFWKESSFNWKKYVKALKNNNNNAIKATKCTASHGVTHSSPKSWTICMKKHYKLGSDLVHHNGKIGMKIEDFLVLNSQKSFKIWRKN